MKDRQTIDVSSVSVNYSSTSTSEAERDTSVCHDRYEILYVTSGSGKYILEGTEFPMIARSLFISAPFEYRALNIDSGECYSRFVIDFSADSLASSAREMLSSMLEDNGGVYFAPAAQHAAVDSIFDRFYIADLLPEREKRAFVEALLTELIVLLSATSGERLVCADDTLVTKVCRYINSNIQRDLSLDTLARRFFVNKYYLCRAFKQQSGTSIHGYINRKRVLYAKQLIESGETASRAAYRVGFCDYSAFYRAYTKIFGTSPTSILKKGSC